MDNLFFTILGIIAAFFGYNYYQGVRYARTKKKIDNRKNEISKMDLASLVAFGNSIIASRRNNNRR